MKCLEIFNIRYLTNGTLEGLRENLEYSWIACLTHNDILDKIFCTDCNFLKL